MYLVSAEAQHPSPTKRGRRTAAVNPAKATLQDEWIKLRIKNRDAVLWRNTRTKKFTDFLKKF
jgi:rRNA maturation protein Nop10